VSSRLCDAATLTTFTFVLTIDETDLLQNLSKREARTRALTDGYIQRTSGRKYDRDGPRVSPLDHHGQRMQLRFPQPRSDRAWRRCLITDVAITILTVQIPSVKQLGPTKRHTWTTPCRRSPLQFYQYMWLHVVDQASGLEFDKPGENLYIDGIQCYMNLFIEYFQTYRANQFYFLVRALTPFGQNGYRFTLVTRKLVVSNIDPPTIGQYGMSSTRYPPLSRRTMTIGKISEDR
jgi:hypothetical protein